MKDYWIALSRRRKIELADELHTVVPYLSQIAHGHRRPGAEFCARIERATGGDVPRESLRPDIFG